MPSIKEPRNMLPIFKRDLSSPESRRHPPSALLHSSNHRKSNEMQNRNHCERNEKRKQIFLLLFYITILFLCFEFYLPSLNHNLSSFCGGVCRIANESAWLETEAGDDRARRRIKGKCKQLLLSLCAFGWKANAARVGRVLAPLLGNIESKNNFRMFRNVLASDTAVFTVSASRRVSSTPRGLTSINFNVTRQLKCLFNKCNVSHSLTLS